MRLFFLKQIDRVERLCSLLSRSRLLAATLVFLIFSVPFTLAANSNMLSIIEDYNNQDLIRSVKLEVSSEWDSVEFAESEEAEEEGGAAASRALRTYSEPLTKVYSAGPVTRDIFVRDVLPVSISEESEFSSKQSTGKFYIEDIPLSEDVQHYIQDKCAETMIPVDIAFTLAFHESTYRTNIIAYGGKETTDQPNRNEDFGLFQINQFNHEWLGEEVGTGSNPLDPFVNTDWAFHILSDYYSKYQEKFSGKRLVDVVLSCYNAGPNFDKHGIMKAYVNGFWEDYEVVGAILSEYTELGSYVG